MIKVIFKIFAYLRRRWLLSIMPIYNKLYCIANGIKFGKSFVVDSYVKLNINKGAIVTIGDYFKMSGSFYINPLCKNKSAIAVDNGAYLKIGCNVGMSSPIIWITKGLTIGDHVDVGGGTMIFDTDAHSLYYLDRRNSKSDRLNKTSKEIIIGDDVLIGANCIILKGVHIGDRAIIGAGSIVTKDIPKDCIAAGDPCRVIRQITNKM